VCEGEAVHDTKQSEQQICIVFVITLHGATMCRLLGLPCYCYFEIALVQVVGVDAPERPECTFVHHGRRDSIDQLLLALEQTGLGLLV
jgi:hypothetical protein